MRTSYRRLALLTGASASALAIAVPAAAATTTSPGISHVDTTDPVADMLLICDLDESCFFGVEADGAGSVSAVVGDPSTGSIEQIGISLVGDVGLTIANRGDAEIGAHASASAHAGVAQANATIIGAIVQSGVGPGDVSLALTNEGDLLIDAIAVADGGTGAAFARANVATGISQLAHSTGEGGSAAIALSNAGALGITAAAHAAGGATVIANANVGGIAQSALAATHVQTTSPTAAGTWFASANDLLGAAAVQLTNSGTMEIAASAVAEGGGAMAFASNQGIAQRAEGTSAAATLDNQGVLEIVSLAAASGDYGVAAAYVHGIDQTATAVEATQSTFVGTGGTLVTASSRSPQGLAAVRLDSSGTLVIAASAVATGEDTALAGANVDGIDQLAAGTSAAVELNNTGSMTLAAIAEATGSFSVEASARVDGIWQIASAVATEQRVERTAAGTSTYQRFTPVGPASVSLVNEGELEIVASAEAVGTGFAIATGSATGIVQGAFGSDASASIDNDGSLVVAAVAEAVGDTAIATAIVNGMYQIASAVDYEKDQFTPVPTGTGTITILSHQSGILITPAGPAEVAFQNDGTVDIRAVAVATGDYGAGAYAEVRGLTQEAIGTSASVSAVNDGDISLLAIASATADSIAYASGFNYGILQMAKATSQFLSVVIPTENGGYDLYNGQVSVGPASASFVNHGSIDVVMVAKAHAAGGTATTSQFAYADARALGVRGFAMGTDAEAGVENSGSLFVGVEAEASGANGALAVAFVEGVRQGANTVGATSVYHFDENGMPTGGDFSYYFTGPASIDVENAGTMTVIANGFASATQGRAQVMADARGIQLSALGTEVDILLDNSGALSVAASAEAVGTTGLASVVAVGATGGAISAGTDYAIDVTNSGSIDVEGSAKAVMDNGATALVAAVGVLQRGTGFEQAALSLDNSGDIDVDAVASAEGGYFAGGTAYATGISHRAAGPQVDFAFDNSGSISASAKMIAEADADTGFAGATAFAHGYTGFAFASNLSLDIVNEGSIEAVARATAEGARGWAYATAGGIAFAAIGSTATTAAGGSLDVSLLNAGTIKVAAFAEGIDDTADGRASTAEAVGILLTGGTVTGTVGNSGTIDVRASVASDAGLVSATGIKVVAGPLGPAAGEDAGFTFTNDGGTIIVRQSSDGGDSWTRGMAIDVAEARSPSVINLLGGESGGSIYGNMDLKDGDLINVRDGETLLDGIINPECVGALDPLLCGQGILNIVEDGTLVLADPRFSGDPDLYDGPSLAFVQALNLDSSGTLAFGLEPESGGEQDPDTYPRLFAGTATLDGTLEARIVTENGLFEDSYLWKDLIVAGTLSGKFDQCVIAGGYAGSVLLDFSCSYDSDSVSAKLERVAFDAVDGLGRNGAAIGGALEDIYDPGIGGGIADLYFDLFRITDADDYALALDQLSGSSYANYLQSFASLGVHYADIADKATSCEVPAHAGSVLECRTDPIHVWGQLDYQNRKADGDVEAGNYRSRRFSGLLGVDASVGESLVLGVTGGSVSNHVRDRRFADKLEGDGYLLGGYGLFDPGVFYVKAIGTYSWFDGDSRRSIDLEPVGGTFAATLEGDPDVRMWTLSLHGGYRITLGASSVVTPYLSLDHVNARLRGFTETASGDEGAELAIGSGRARNSFATAGVKWSGRIGGLVPEANLAYRHRFGDTRAQFTGRGIGGEDADFRIVSAAEKRGSLIAGVSLGGRVGPVDLRIGYEGEFNKAATSHSGSFKLVVPFGGRPAPTPAPAMLFVPVDPAEGAEVN